MRGRNVQSNVQLQMDHTIGVGQDVLREES